MMIETTGTGSGPARAIAYVGKGGTGKTALAALTARALLGSGSRVLLIDADPAGGLCLALGRESVRTVAGVRERVIREARERPEGSEGSGGERLALTVDYLVMESLMEFEGYSLLAMGQAEGPGCYCPVNTLVRESIEGLAAGFDYIVVDAEAGLEQVSRQLLRRVEWPVIVTDSSLRGARTAAAIGATLARLGQPLARGVIFNRADEVDHGLREVVEGAGLLVLGTVPVDERVAAYDREGRSLLELPGDSAALTALGSALEGAGFRER